MKRVLATLVMAVVMFSVAFAQDDNQRQGNRPDPAQMVQQMTERMASRYSLNDNQKAALLKVNTEYASKFPRMGRPHGGRPGMRGGRQGFNGGRPGGQRPDSTQAQRPRPSREEMEQRFKEMRATQEAYNAEVKKIMTDEQYQKFTEDQQNFRRPARQNESK